MSDKAEIIKSVKAGIEHARNMGNADSLIYLQDQLARLEAEAKCKACGKEHTGWECPNAHGGWE